MQKIPVADAHCDFLYYMVKDKWRFDKPTSNQAIALPYMKVGGAALQLFAAWIDPDSDKDAYTQCNDMMDAYDVLLQNNLELVSYSKEFKPNEGKIAAMLTIEGGEAIMGSLERLAEFYQRGVRMMTLTWNSSNELAHPAMSRLNFGLTRLGKQIVREMNTLGIAVDVAHLSDAGINDVLKLSHRPVIASHSNSRTVYKHKRSLKDVHVKEIADGGGIVCVNYYPPQLNGTNEANVSDIVRHIAYLVDLVGTDCVGLGSDFDGMPNYPKNLSNWSMVPNLLNEMKKTGFSEAEIQKIAYDNLAKYLLNFV